MTRIRELMICVMLSAASLVLSAPPVLDPIPKPSVSVSEDEKQPQVLVKGITCSDPDGDVTRVFVTSVHPSHPCGRCFPVRPCPSGRGYCLMFEPGLGRLHYESVTSYVVQVTCTDDVDRDVSSRIIDVQLQANAAPVFADPGSRGATTEIKHAYNKHGGDLVYDVNAHDVDNDVLMYSMLTEPATDLFEIGQADGKIRVTQDLRQFCEDSVTFRIFVTDSHHTSVGPALLHSLLKSKNHRPVITNTKTELQVPEDKDFSFHLKVEDVDGDEVLFKMRAVPERGLEYYTIDKKGVIRPRKPLDYEYALLRNVDLYVDVTDGFCDADTFQLTIRITDVNEEPVIQPDYVEMTVYEGFISVDPGWTVADPDEAESHVWQGSSGSGGVLTIDRATGIIHSTGEVDIDPAPSKKFNFKVQVKDKGQLKDTAVLALTVLDKNDHVPTFVKHVYEFGASPCTKVGSIVGAVHAKDKDSTFQGNHALVYSGSGRNISVLSTGSVVLMTPCTPGDVETIEGHVTDQGRFPGPLTGVPTTVTLRCSPCPEPVTTEATVNLTSDPGPLESHTDGLPPLLSWLVPAAFLALSLAPLLAYVISRYCRRACAAWRARRALRKKSFKQMKRRSKVAVSPKDLSIVEMKLTPPVPPPAETDPFLFGFWKETYADRDQRRMPRRDAVPASVKEDEAVREKEREEEEKEKEKRRQARQKVEEKYQAELSKYRRQIEAIGGRQSLNSITVSLSSQAATARKSRLCAVL